ncbi:S-ribosylhomocysteine lyase [Dysosmobacter sp.]|uniref:S-ribosylhomocysteine lyase n=1 Tax=Dysosmobacter sp. TaxID=2591382 RepID=UPI002A8F3CC6|nr:S-ribosylhomocysteine lyase [Dysosmobacter sp.]MDY3281573.1 S-ribosylhomocysteine lyase [Dysosmobacter sp.]
MSNLERIASFTVDHNRLVPGLYYSRRDGDVVTFDLRFKKPNTGDLLSNSEMHSVEHLIATLLRNSEDREAVIYFGPMGCQTGFYFLFDNRLLSCEGAIRLVQEVFAQAAEFTGEMPGKSAAECGNYANLDVETGRAACRFYADLIRDWTVEKLSYEA